MDFHDLVSGRRQGGWAATERALLRLAEVPYRWAVQLRNRRYDRHPTAAHRVGVPVISVGNITTGGTGKTPLVAWLTRWYRSRGARVAIISRGYRSAAGKPNDEALELARSLPEVPHIQNPDRVAAARLAIAAHRCDLIVLDDGFQHRRIHRDLDIVLIDALEPFGFRHLLPRGLLREPLEQLARAHVVALSRADAVDPARRDVLRDEVEKLAPQATWIEMAHKPIGLIAPAGERLASNSLADQQVVAFCGIGNPRGFRHSLEHLGCQIAAFRAFPDHHQYGPRDLAALEQLVSSHTDVAAVICTGKDLVKLDVHELGHRPLHALAIEIDVIRGIGPLTAHLEARCPTGDARPTQSLG